MTFSPIENSLTLESAILARHQELDNLQLEITFLCSHMQQLAELKQQQMQENLKLELTQRIEQLEALSDIINALSYQLEIELNNFKEIAVETNKLYQKMQDNSEFRTMELESSKTYRLSPRSIWQVHYSCVPQIMKKIDCFILTHKNIDLFKQDDKERECQNKLENSQNCEHDFSEFLEKSHNI
ncbi:hypothetical protein ACF3DV_02365 [Chlorogloeopsis fritschii PCC 9212]|uniref:Uncharacterized protein n=1 Tax=Chlorogloeopsis fritschii PCC 6912 TaxID=211165 RepID=A0A433MWS5_CHLFR|nr:hypothetical protein [Chlorogloeopsis fritschii]RUR72497.1 hypothetical protein PCC6912_62350 [Chlorogloeopsis fritschii PCC 6912]